MKKSLKLKLYGRPLKRSERAAIGIIDTPLPRPPKPINRHARTAARADEQRARALDSAEQVSLRMAETMLRDAHMI